jgi:hypothetical protein
MALKTCAKGTVAVPNKHRSSGREEVWDSVAVHVSDGCIAYVVVAKEF